MKPYPHILAAVALTILSAGAQAQTPSPAIAQALSDPARADQQDEDARRKAAEVLAFSGVKPGDTVIDFIPGAGYWSRIFSAIVGSHGHVYALWPQSSAQYATQALPALQARHLANLSAEVQADDTPAVPEPVDLFWTVQNYHDMANQGPQVLLAYNQAAYAALKPGGIYMVIDHADAAGSGLSGTASKHRIDKAVVIEQVQAAGFTLEAESTVLGNPADDHAAKVFDPAIKGHTDQFVLKFRKPR